MQLRGTGFEADRITTQSRHDLQQILKALHRKVFRGTSCRVLLLRRLRSLGFRHDRLPRRLSGFEVIVVEDQFTQRITPVPFDLIRQHAQEHMRSNPIIVPVVNRANVQINRLQTSKRTLDFRKALVRQHDMARIHSLERHARANHVEAIQGSLRRNVVLTTRI